MNTLEPELQQAPVISANEALELLDSKFHNFVNQSHEFRQFTVHSVPFIARLSQEKTHCDQLWSLGKHRDNTRLSVYFHTVELRDRFERVARRLKWNSRDLAEKLLCDFMNAVDKQHREE